MNDFLTEKNKKAGVLGKLKWVLCGFCMLLSLGAIGASEKYIGEGQLYKFFIVGAHGEKLYKADPYANEAELRPGTAGWYWPVHHLLGRQRQQGQRCRQG